MNKIQTVAPPFGPVVRVDATGRELKRGVFFNAIASATSSFRGIFTILVARMLGSAPLGLFSVAWASTDIISKIGIFGLDETITTFIARSEALGNHAHSRTLFRIGAVLAFLQSIIFAAVAIAAIHLFGHRLGLEPELISALGVILCAMPGIALYRMCTAASRAMKVMQHDIYSRGITESVATTLAFLVALGLGAKRFAPEIAAIVGSFASGIVALCFATHLFRDVAEESEVSFFREAKGLLAYGAPITAYQLLNTFIAQLDIIMLGFFIGRAPGVTLATVGVYGAVVEIAIGVRKVNQAFNPIFAPVVAGMTATGDHHLASATYARIAQWMLWILLPFVTVMVLAGSVILAIYGRAFEEGGTWLVIVSLGCATNAFVSLGETVIMVQRPRWNLINSSITCALAAGANLWLIPKFGVTGAAFGILLPFIIQGVLRFLVLRFVFQWPAPWKSFAPPLIASVIALLPALVCRAFIEGIPGQLTSALVFLAVFGTAWIFARARTQPA